MRTSQGPAIAGALVALLGSTTAVHRARAELPEEAPNISNELLDPDGRTRGHLVGRANFSDGQKVFSSSSIWSFEALLHVRIIEGLAASVALPFGYIDVTGAQQFFFGNLGVGVAGGRRIHLASDPSGEETGPILRVGGGIDAYAPTAPRPDTSPSRAGMIDTRLLAEQTIALMRAYTPQLYEGDIMSFRARAHADITINILTAEIELGLIPAFTLTSQSSFLMWFCGAGRIVARPTTEIEPYLEMSGSVQIKGDNKLNPPFLLTPGVRFHILTFDPAVFASFNFVQGKSVIFGIDLAGALRKTRSDLSDDISTDRFHL
jgi:hypothetical protein